MKIKYVDIYKTISGMPTCNKVLINITIAVFKKPFNNILNSVSPWKKLWEK